MTDHHKHSDLEQHKLIISRFWKSEVGNACHWAKIKCWQAALLIRGLEKNLFSGLLQLLEGTLIPWLMALLHLQSQQLQPYNHFHHHIFLEEDMNIFGGSHCSAYHITPHDNSVESCPLH